MLQHKKSDDDADNDDTRTMLFADMRLGCVCVSVLNLYKWIALDFAISSYFRNGRRKKNRMEPKKRTKSKRHKNECNSFEWVLQSNFSISIFVPYR